MKIVLNNEYGGFSLSEAAYQELGLKWDGYGFAEQIERNDPRLVACVEKLGSLASGSLASLIVVEIPDDVE
jgi:hypothetical protein